MADAPLDPEEAARLLLERAGDSAWARETIALGLRAKAEGLRRDAARLEALAGRVVSGDLTVARPDDTVNTMNTAPTTESLRSRGRLSEEARSHLFVAALVGRNETVAEAAAWLTKTLGRNVPRSTVQSWYKPKDDPSYRAIPGDAEKAIRKRYKVPRSAWPRVID